MEEKIRAFVLRAVDYKENDKLLTLFSAESGKITAAIRGVKKPKAKLKFAAQPFTLAEYVLAKNGTFYTVTQAEAVDMFFPLTADVKRFYTASCMAQLLCQILQEEQPAPALVLDLGEILRILCYEKNDELLCFLHFMLQSAKEEGISFHFQNCAQCGKELDCAYFSFDSGAVYCEECRKKSAILLKDEVYSLLSTIEGLSVRELVGKKGNAVAEKASARLLADFFIKQTDVTLSSLSDYLALYKE